MGPMPWRCLFVLVLGCALSPAFAQVLPAPSDRLCTAGFNPDYGWFDVDAGRLGVLAFPGLLHQGQCIDITSAPLKVNLGGMLLPLSSEIRYSHYPYPTWAAPGLSVVLAEPALCEDYFAGGAGEATWNFAIEDANGEVMIENLRGVAAFRHAVTSGVSRPVMVASYGSTPWLRCFSGLTANADLHPGEPGESMSLFANGFEALLPNLQVEFLTATGDAPLASDVIEQAIGGEVSYLVRIRNVGEGDAYGVRVREFVPEATALLMPTVTRVACIDKGSDGSGNAACTNGMGAAAFRQTLGSLAPGEQRDFLMTRRSGTTDTGPGQPLALVQVAVFADPAVTEPDLADNSRALHIRVVDE
ncbi:hypothetical protein OS187_02635 [Xanthomonadaceae bacterium JHOS43]|nr:hypothetical protein [Xanthomonadaceae bacterium JHOS43]